MKSGMAFSITSTPVFASSARFSGHVSIFSDEGQRLSEAPLISRSQIPTSVVWHPTKQVLATGWEKGEVTILNVAEKEQFSAPLTHTSEVTCLAWSANGA